MYIFTLFLVSVAALVGVNAEDKAFVFFDNMMDKTTMLSFYGLTEDCIVGTPELCYITRHYESVACRAKLPDGWVFTEDVTITSNGSDDSKVGGMYFVLSQEAAAVVKSTMVDSGAYTEITVNVVLLSNESAPSIEATALQMVTGNCPYDGEPTLTETYVNYLYCAQLSACLPDYLWFITSDYTNYREDIPDFDFTTCS